jgi:hypothetical protein
MRRNEMRKAYKPVFLVLFLVLVSCAEERDYVWYEYPILSQWIPPQVSFTEGQDIKIIEGKSNDSKVFLGGVGRYRYYGSLQSLTHGITVQLAGEMGKKGLKVKNTAGKSLEVTVDRTNFKAGFVKTASTIEYTVKSGNGKTKPYTVTNSSGGMVDQAYNGAVALAVIKIMSDPEVLNYINE